MYAVLWAHKSNLFFCKNYHSKKIFFNLFYDVLPISSASKGTYLKPTPLPYSIPFATRNNAHSFQKHYFYLAIAMSLHLKSTAIGTQKQCFYLQGL